MKTDKEIRALIEKTTANYKHVLNCGPATISINAPRALMQVEACSRLDALYEIIGEIRPKFTCDQESKLNR